MRKILSATRLAAALPVAGCDESASEEIEDVREGRAEGAERLHEGDVEGAIDARQEAAERRADMREQHRDATLVAMAVPPRPP